MYKRKRIKLECLKCGSQFDDDYRTRHENAKHNGERMRVKVVGAPTNPFEASKRKVAKATPPVVLSDNSIEKSLINEVPSQSNLDKDSSTYSDGLSQNRQVNNENQVEDEERESEKRQKIQMDVEVEHEEECSQIHASQKPQKQLMLMMLRNMLTGYIRQQRENRK